MAHNPVHIKSLGLSFNKSNCFENFSTQIPFGSKIGIIGRNGTGKSSLLKMFLKEIIPTEGEIYIPDNMKVAYVPQVVSGKTFQGLSGGQRFNKALGEALGRRPNLLLLDEPTNHLDHDNRQSLMKMINNFLGTCLIVSHDPELLRKCIQNIWHIKDQEVTVFSGNYDSYLCEQGIQTKTKKNAVQKLTAQKREIERGVSGNFKICNLHSAMKSKIDDKLSTITFDKTILPSFALNSDCSRDNVLISVSEGIIKYANDKRATMKKVNLTIRGGARIAITGKNGSGKSTIFRALMADPIVRKSGEWEIAGIKPDEFDLHIKEIIGYLDQHYSNLNPEHTVYESISYIRPDWLYEKIRGHLSSFLFKSNESIEGIVRNLSGGEKARLSLAQIAAHSPRLLLLDEITNNVDLDTRNYIIDVLNQYDGALLVISHDQDFLDQIKITKSYRVEDGHLL
jgi:ATPase subunit of ABC transporter with duplicated ATPase domains